MNAKFVWYIFDIFLPCLLLSTVFLYTDVFKGPRLSTLRIFESQTHFKPTETFQYTHFSSCQPFITEEGFIKGEALCLLTNQVKENFGMYKRFSLNTGISFNSNLDLHIFVTSHQLYLTGRKKITLGCFSSHKTSHNHHAIIKSCKQRSTFKRFVFPLERN